MTHSTHSTIPARKVTHGHQCGRSHAHMRAVQRHGVWAAHWRPMWMGKYLHTSHTRASCAKHHHAFVLATPHYNCTLHPYARRQAPTPPHSPHRHTLCPTHPPGTADSPLPLRLLSLRPHPAPHAATSTVPNPAPCLTQHRTRRCPRQGSVLHTTARQCLSPAALAGCPPLPAPPISRHRK